jgi:hypothetical protein
MTGTWVLLANVNRARFLQHDSAIGGLVELAGFIYPPASTLVESSSPLAGRAHSRFARQLAEYLNKAVADRRCERVALTATEPMLGKLRPMLSQRVSALLLRCVDSDFTRCHGPDLQQRVHQALGPLA